MSRVSLIERNKKRERMSSSLKNKREKLLAVARSRVAAPEDVFEANLKLAALPKTQCLCVFTIVAHCRVGRADTIANLTFRVLLYVSLPARDNFLA